MKKVFVLIICVLMVAMVTGCASKGSDETTGTEDAGTETTGTETTGEEATGEEATGTEDAEAHNFVFVSGTMSNSFFIAISDTFQSLCDEAGYGYTVYDCDWDNALQITQVEDAVNSKPDMIFFVAADVDGAREGLKYAYDAGVPVIVIDNPVPDTDIVISTIASDNYLGGYLCAQALIEDFPEGAKIGVLDMPSNGACRDRMDGFNAGLAEAENPDLYEIVAELDGGGMLDSSIQPAEDILQAHPEITAFFTINGLSAQGVITASESAGREIPLIYTVDASPDDKEFLIDGKIRFEAAQSPFTIAQTSFENAVVYLAGEEIEATIDIPTFEMTIENAKATRGSWQ